MLNKKWLVYLSLVVISMGLGLLLVVQLRTQNSIRQVEIGEDWAYVVSELIESNARLREEVKALQTQLSGFESVEGGGVLLQSLVDEVNYLRIANGQVRVSGPGVEAEISGPISVLDLHDLINELRNAGSEALALNEQRIVAWSAISTDGERVTVDGQPVQAPYHLRAIGDAHTLEVALTRPGGLVDLLGQVHPDVSITVFRREKLTLPVCGQAVQFVYSEPLE